MYECEHQNKTIRKVESECDIIVCNKCYEEFTNVDTRPLYLAKQILTLSNKMIENMPTFMSGKGPDNSLNSWYDCNKKVLEQLKVLEIGQYTSPIQAGSSFLILKIEEIKYENAVVNEDEELNKMIRFETNKQLEQFSKIFYGKIKINSLINEL